MSEGAPIGGYRLVRQIGEGGMGVVWMAEHEVLGRRAAIKILRPEYSLRRDTLKRFFNEARAATAISDPGIIQIFDVGHHTDGRAYIVMELLDGESLDNRLSRTSVLSIGSALRLCRQVASAVGAAHARGITHRDLKPGNIFVVRDAEVTGGERAKVLDFGIAKLAGDFGADFTTSVSTIIGTPPYMSPEQCRGAGEVDHRSDIYSLGCVLFSLIAGRPPFDTKATGVLIMQHMADPPPRPSTCATDVPAEVDALILRCLAKDPADRFPSGTELAYAIDALLELPSVIAAATRPRAMLSGPVAVSPALLVATTLDAPGTFVTRAPTPVAARRRGKRYAGIAAALMLAAAAAALAVAGDPPASDPPTVVAPPRSSTGADDPRPAQARAGLRAQLLGFLRWAADHPGAPCPTGADLDPWGHTYELTCSEQPADQMVGARSFGPDGARATADDLTSWTQGPDAVELVRGKRWTAAPIARPRPDPTPRADAPRRGRRPAATPPTAPPVDPGIIDVDGDGIPDSRFPASAR